MLKEAGVCLVGGHTVDDNELKYGLSVTGLINPNDIIRNSTARPGDILILTKPLGTGIISTAVKGEMAKEKSAAEAMQWMSILNRSAAELMRKCNASAATDVTGFGLIGHCSEMARGAQVSIRLNLDKIPLMHGVKELVADGMVPAGCYRNRDHYAPLVNSKIASKESLLPLFDPQTSGGLMISLTIDDAQNFLAEAKQQGIFANEIGEVLTQQSNTIEIA